MRLWHKDLIDVLPRQQLIGQWRECCGIAKTIAEKGTPNHILVNKIMDYDMVHFYAYSSMVTTEMIERGYKVNDKAFNNFIKNMRKAEEYFTLTMEEIPDKNMLYSKWHNKRYLTQCYHNLL